MRQVGRETISIVRHVARSIGATTVCFAATSVKVSRPHPPRESCWTSYSSTSMQPTSIVLFASTCGNVFDQEQFLRNDPVQKAGATAT